MMAIPAIQGRARAMPDQAPACAASMQAGTARPVVPVVVESLVSPDIRLFVGGDGTYIGGRRMLLHGDREFTAAHPPRCCVADVRRVAALLDSGAFTDGPDDRLTPAAALARQLAWEGKARTSGASHSKQTTSSATTD